MLLHKDSISPPWDRQKHLSSCEPALSTIDFPEEKGLQEGDIIAPQKANFQFNIFRLKLVN